MLFQTKSLAPTMLQLERLPMDEASQPHLDELTLIESEKLDKKVLSLEKALHYCDETYSTLDDVLFEMANRHHINESDIIFSITPQSVYFDEEVNGMVRYFLKEDIPFCLSCNMASREGRLISELCTMSESMGTTEPFDVLLEFDFFNENQAVDAGWTGAASGAASGLGGVLRGFGSSLKRGVKAGLQRGFEGLVDRQVLGRVLDSRETTTDRDGQTVIKVNRNGNLRNAVGSVWDNDEAKNFAGAVSDEIRGQLSSDIVRALGNGVRKMTPKGILNAIEQKLGYFGNRIAEGKGNPQKLNLFQRIIVKLKALRDKILARLRGHAY